MKNITPKEAITQSVFRMYEIKPDLTGKKQDALKEEIVLLFQGLITEYDRFCSTKNDSDAIFDIYEKYAILVEKRVQEYCKYKEDYE